MHALLLQLWGETRMTVFMVTHDLSEGFNLGTRLLVFDFPARTRETLLIETPAKAAISRIFSFPVIPHPLRSAIFCTAYIYLIYSVLPTLYVRNRP